MQRGFTVLELLVAVALMAIIMSVVFGNYPEFNRRVSLDGIASKIALTIREAQADSLAGKGFVKIPGCFPGYGVYFNVASGVATSYDLFADIPAPPVTCPPTNAPGDGERGGGVEDLVQEIALKPGYSITDICVGADCTINTLTILFPKRQSGAVITSVPAAGGPHSEATITVSRGNISRNIKVGISGHAYVQ